MMPVNRAFRLTSPGTAAIAVIRIRGPLVIPFLQKHFSRSAKLNRCVHGELRDGDTVIDDPVIVLFDNAQSADLNVHGGAWIVTSVLRLLEREGFEIARDDQLDLLEGQTLLEREMHAHLPLAATEPALRMLLAQPQAWKDFLASTPTPQQLEAIAHDQTLWRLLHPPTVAIVGPPNVGKSTLANQLFAQQRSITADLPGTTRDYIGELADIDGLPVMLIDTPGLRESSDPIERAAIEASQRVVNNADLQIVVQDPDHRAMRTGDNQILVANKADLLKNRAPDALLTIATTGQGIDKLRYAIRSFFGCQDFTPNRPRWWTQRQRDVLAGGVQNIRAMS